MSPEPSAEERLTQLEIQLAHAMRLYEQLNEVVTEQASRLDRQQRVLVRLAGQLKEVKEKSEPVDEPLDEKPPHY